MNSFVLKNVRALDTEEKTIMKIKLQINLHYELFITGCPMSRVHIASSIPAKIRELCRVRVVE